MGNRVQIDFAYAPLCDRLVVNQLIKNRISLDPMITYNQDQEIMATYIDLDNIIESIHLAPKQKKMLDLMMSGYTFADISSQLGQSSYTYRTLLSRVVKKISDAAKKSWADWHECV